MYSIVNERQMDFADILKEGLNIFFFKFKEMALISLGGLLPLNILSITFMIYFPSLRLGSTSAGLLLAVIFSLVQMVIGIIVITSIAIIIEKTVQQKDVTVLTSVKSALSMWGSATVTYFLYILIYIGLSLLLIVPGIIYSNYYSFFMYAVALRGKTGMEALQYSKKLVEGQWWRVFGILLGISLILGVVPLIILFPFIRIHTNPYWMLIPNAFLYLIVALSTVMEGVLFLNNDYVAHHRLVRRTEKPGWGGNAEAPSFDEWARRSTAEKSQPVKRTAPKKAARKPLKKTITRKKSSSTRK